MFGLNTFLLEVTTLGIGYLCTTPGIRPLVLNKHGSVDIKWARTISAYFPIDDTTSIRPTKILHGPIFRCIY